MFLLEVDFAAPDIATTCHPLSWNNGSTKATTYLEPAMVSHNAGVL